MDSKYSDDTLVSIIESEGLGYAVLYYLGSDNIESEDTAILWKAAADALEALKKHLEIY